MSNQPSNQLPTFVVTTEFADKDAVANLVRAEDASVAMNLAYDAYPDETITGQEAASLKDAIKDHGPAVADLTWI